MISYDLAKQLKEAGFPLRYATGDAPDLSFLICVDAFWYWPPTLEELIDGCGDKFGYVGRVIKGDSTTGYVTTWYATELGKPMQEIYGPTSSEAVARLYLALKN